MCADMNKMILDALPGTSADLRNRTGFSKTTVSRRLYLLIKAKQVRQVDSTKRPKMFVPCLPDGSYNMSRAPAMVVHKVKFTAPARHYLFSLYGG